MIRDQESTAVQLDRRLRRSCAFTPEIRAAGLLSASGLTTVSYPSGSRYRFAQPATIVSS
jgi:hypothetical protein